MNEGEVSFKCQRCGEKTLSPNKDGTELVCEYCYTGIPRPEKDPIDIIFDRIDSDTESARVIRRQTCHLISKGIDDFEDTGD